MYIQMFIELLQASQTKKARRGQKNEEDVPVQMSPWIANFLETGVSIIPKNWIFKKDDIRKAIIYLKKKNFWKKIS